MQSLDKQQKIDLFKSVFKVRTDVMGLSYQKITGDWTGLSLKNQIDDNVILTHLSGKSIDTQYPFPQVLGGYLVTSNKCQIAVIDIDEDYIPFVEDYLDITRQMEMPVYVECSKLKGYHIWHFFDEPILAIQARNLLLGIMKQAGLPEHTEVFPKQVDVSRGKGLGNYINLPLNGKFAVNKRMVFLNPDDIFNPYENQWELLQSIETISSDFLTGIDAKPSTVDIGTDEVSKKKCSELLLDGSSVGGRRPAMASMGGYLIRRVDKDVFMSIMDNWNQTHNKPPLSKEDLATQCENLYRTYGGDAENSELSPEELCMTHPIMAEKYRQYVHKLQDTRILLGWNTFDDIMRGICPGETLVILAEPNAGKTALAQTIMYGLWERQHLPSLMFSLEMSVESLYERGASMVMKRSGRSIERAFLDGDDDDILEKMSNDYQQVMFTDMTGLSIAKMRDVIESVHVKPALVVIDYLTLIKPSTGNNTYEMASKVSKDLQKLAKDTNVAIIVLSQVNRGASSGEELTMRSARNSGEIEEDAFFIIGLWKNKENPRQRIMKLLKNKRGESGTELLLGFTDESPRLYALLEDNHGN